MVSALVLVILVNASELKAPGTATLKTAAEEVLGEESQVLVRGISRPLDDAQLADSAEGADAVAEVIWQDNDRKSAVVRCYIKRRRRFVSKEIVFGPTDQERERERMVGFVAGSMLPEALPELWGKPAPAPPPKVEPKPAEPPPPAPPPKRWFGAADVTLVGAGGIPRDASGFGASVAGHWYALPPLSLRASGAVRFGDLSSAQASTTLIMGGLGVGWRLWQPQTEGFELTGRADLLVSQLSVSHVSPGSPDAERRSRAIPGADLVAEGAWYWTRDAALLASFGVELAFGRTAIVIRDRQAAEIPPFRLVGEAGLRVRF